METNIKYKKVIIATINDTVSINERNFLPKTYAFETQFQELVEYQMSLMGYGCRDYDLSSGKLINDN